MVFVQPWEDGRKLMTSLDKRLGSVTLMTWHGPDAALPGLHSHWPIILKSEARRLFQCIHYHFPFPNPFLRVCTNPWFFHSKKHIDFLPLSIEQEVSISFLDILNGDLQMLLVVTFTYSIEHLSISISRESRDSIIPTFPSGQYPIN